MTYKIVPTISRDQGRVGNLLIQVNRYRREREMLREFLEKKIKASGKIRTKAFREVEKFIESGSGVEDGKVEDV